MNVDTLTSLIDNFRSLTQAGSISPETVGSILQKIADALSQAVVEEAVRELQSWKAVVAALPNYIASLTPGEETATGLTMDADVVNLLTGTHALSNAFEIPKATEEHSGLMTAMTMRKFNGHSEDIMRNFSTINLVKNDVEHLEETVNTLQSQMSGINVSGSGVYDVKLGSSNAAYVYLNISKNDPDHQSISVSQLGIPPATSERAGVMTSDMFTTLNAVNMLSLAISNCVMDVQLGDEDVNSIYLRLFSNDPSTQSFEQTLLEIPAATSSRAGAMTAQMFQSLEFSRGVANTVANAVMDVRLGETDTNSVSLTVYNNNQASQSFQSTTLTLPTASATQAGVMTADMVQRIIALERKVK